MPVSESRCFFDFFGFLLNNLNFMIAYMTIVNQTKTGQNENQNNSFLLAANFHHCFWP